MARFLPPARTRFLAAGSSWLYLGKDPAAPARLEERWGRPPRPLAGLLHEEARRLRGPFLEAVAALGRGQDPAAWWAGALAGKSWDFSDLFLLSCSLAVCRRLAAEPGPLTVVVEDPWLLAALPEALRDFPAASVTTASLLPERLRCLAWGLARRLKWCLRTAWGRFSQAAHWRVQSGSPPRDGVLIYSHLIARSLKVEGRWEDPFLTGLDAELAEAGTPVARLTYSDIMGLEGEAARRKSYVLPAILWSSWKGFFGALTALPPTLPRRMELAGLPIGLLLEREWWHDFSRAARCAYLFFHDCVRNLLADGAFKALAMPWEAQPQERMLVLAAQAAGVRSVGYQHTTVPAFQLPFFSTAKGYLESPLPDVLLVSGEHPARVLLEAGFPAGRLKIGGTRRYAHFLRDGAFPKPPASRDVLVMLPIDAWQARHLLAALERAYPDGLDGGRFLLRPHPAGPEDVRRARFPVELAEGPMDAVLARCGAVVFAGSTAGLDALTAGHPVLRYRSELLLDLDPTDMFSDEQIPTASDADLRERLEEMRKSPPPAPEESIRLRLREVFSPLDRAVWKEALLGPSPRSHPIR